MTRSLRGSIVALAAAVCVLGFGAAALAETNCTDGVDNDNDGRIDYNDPSCVEKWGALYWPPITPDPCTDGVNNNAAWNALTDAADPGCSEEISVPSHATRWNYCSDGIDNDGDTLVDAADPSCNEMGTTLCSNSLDDDYDGIWDFGPNYAVSAGKPVVAFSGWGDSSCHEMLCQDGIDNDGDGKTDGPVGGVGGDEDCWCLHDVVDEQLSLPGFGNNACTANDTSFVLVGLGVQGDGCINGTDYITMFFEARLKTTAATRYDLGMWISLDGTDAYNYNSATKGTCGHQVLRPGSGALGTCDVTTNPNCSTIEDEGFGILRTLTYINPHDGPYRQGETKVEEYDRCAEIEQEKWTAPEEDAVIDIVTAPRQDLVVLAGSWVSDDPDAVGQLWDRNVRPAPAPYRFLCQDIIGVDATVNQPNGYADIGTCASWDQQSNSLANEFSQAYPGTSSKCRCERTPTDIPVPQMELECVAGAVPAPPAGLDAGDAVTNAINVHNVVSGCTPSGTDQRLRCGTAGYIAVVIEIVDLSNNPIPGQLGDFSGVVDSTGGTTRIVNASNRLIWVPRNTRLLAGIDTLGGAYGVVGPDANATPESFQYTFTRGSGGIYSTYTGDLRFRTTTYWSNSPFASPATTAPTDAQIDAFVAGATAQTCVGCLCPGELIGTTPVTLASAEAVRSGAAVRFVWTTATEVENVGFHLYGKTPSGWVRLNADLIPAAGGGIVEQRYEVTIQVPEGITEFYIEDVDRSGKTTPHRLFTAVDDGRGTLGAGVVAGAAPPAPTGAALDPS